MEAQLENPLHHNRYDVNGVHNTGISEWKKKRKFHIDQFDLQRPKHKCWIGNSSSENDSIVENNSGAESVKDSNSWIEDSDSNTTMSIDNGGSLEADSMKSFKRSIDKEYNPSKGYALDDLEEHFLGLQDSDHIYSDYIKETESTQDMFCSKGDNANMFVEKWNVDQEAQSNSRPPTIDEEFEQYFSMLMI